MGGEIALQIETTDNDLLFGRMVDKGMPMVDGSIEVLSGNGQVCIRRIEFKEAYIYSYGERMQSYSSLPMTTTIRISPMRLDYNNNILRLDRKWPRAKHGWQKFVEEKVKHAENGPDKSPEITNIYWKDADGNRISNLPRQGIATLCAQTENTDEGDTVCFDVELENGNTISVSGKVDFNGFVEITNINLDCES